jgi:hypothetical protein
MGDAGCAKAITEEMVTRQSESRTDLKRMIDTNLKQKDLDGNVSKAISDTAFAKLLHSE